MTLYSMVSANKFSHSACRCCFLLIFVCFIYLGIGKLFPSKGSADQWTQLAEYPQTSTAELLSSRTLSAGCRQHHPCKQLLFLGASP